MFGKCVIEWLFATEVLNTPKEAALAAAWCGVMPGNFGIGIGVVEILPNGVEFEDGLPLEFLSGSIASIAGVVGLEAVDEDFGDEVMAAKKLAGRGTGDCLGGICKSVNNGALNPYHH